MDTNETWYPWLTAWMPNPVERWVLSSPERPIMINVKFSSTQVNCLNSFNYFSPISDCSSKLNLSSISCCGRFSILSTSLRNLKINILITFRCSQVFILLINHFFYGIVKIKWVFFYSFKNHLQLINGTPWVMISQFEFSISDNLSFFVWNRLRWLGSVMTFPFSFDSLCTAIGLSSR